MARLVLFFSDAPTPEVSCLRLKFFSALLEDSLRIRVFGFALDFLRLLIFPPGLGGTVRRRINAAFCPFHRSKKPLSFFDNPCSIDGPPLLQVRLFACWPYFFVSLVLFTVKDFLILS